MQNFSSPDSVPSAPYVPSVPSVPQPASTRLPTRRRGRPTSYTDETIDLICHFIREEGLSDSAAAAAAAVSPATLGRWKREHEELEIELSLARGEFRSAQLNIIKRAAQAGGQRGWRAAAWLLERIFPEDYSPKAAERFAL